MLKFLLINIIVQVMMMIEKRIMIKRYLVLSSTMLVAFILPIFLFSACWSSQMTLSEATKRVSPYVVQISLVATNLDDGRDYVAYTIGTGFLVNRDGYIITASHIIDFGEQYMQKIQAVSKKLVIIIPAFEGLGKSLPEPEHTLTNDFDIITRDSLHDLALLRVKMDYGPNPFHGEIMGMVQYSNGTGGTLNIEPLPLDPNIPDLGDEIATSSYPLEQLDLITNTGYLTSMEMLNIKDARLSGAIEGLITGNITDCFYTDIVAGLNNSGGPLYLIRTGSIVGMCISITNQLGGPFSTIMIPACFIIDLLNDNNVNWAGK